MNLNREIDLTRVDTKTALRIMVAESNVRGVSEIARMLEMQESTLRTSIARGSLRLEDMKKIAEKLGYSVIVRKD